MDANATRAPSTTATGQEMKGAWLDLVAFGASLALAWALRWQTTDLVWSLWLSSLTVGYAMIVWKIFQPILFITNEARRNGMPVLGQAGFDAVFAVGGLVALAFMTVHFGGFHYIHSIFLNHFFPVTTAKGNPTLSTYLTVLGRYWYFIPVAALAERQAFRIAARKAPGQAEGTPAKGSKPANEGVLEAYKNVVRMHMLIFFFAFAHVAKLDNFITYAAVYAVYFFPWRLVFKPKA